MPSKSSDAFDFGGETREWLRLDLVDFLKTPDNDRDANGVGPGSARCFSSQPKTANRVPRRFSDKVGTDGARWYRGRVFLEFGTSAPYRFLCKARVYRSR